VSLLFLILFSLPARGDRRGLHSFPTRRSSDLWELLNDDYQSPIPNGLRWRNWAADPEGMTGEDLKNFIDNILFPGLQQLHTSGDARAVVIRNVFEDAYNYMKSGQLIRQVINKIQEGIDYNNSKERHA